MTADELMQWCADHRMPDGEPWPMLPKQTLREMESEGITFEIEGGAPKINYENWIGYP